MVVMGMKRCRVCCSCVVIGGIGHAWEIAHLLEKGSICSIWQLSVKTLLTAPPLWWAISCYVDLELAPGFSLLIRGR